MSHLSDDFEGLVGALQEELPTSADRSRVRTRLETAGVLVAGSTLLAAGLSEGLAGGAQFAPLAPKAGMLAKLAALGATSKALVAVSFASVVTLPLLWSSVPSDAGRGAASPANPSSSNLGLKAQSSHLSSGRGSAESASVTARGDDDLGQASASDRAANSRAVDPRVQDSSAALSRATVSSRETERTSSKSMGESRAEAREAGKLAKPSSLQAETALIEQALAALRRGERARARAFLEAHQERFPEGALAPERRQTLERLAQTTDIEDTLISRP